MSSEDKRLTEEDAGKSVSFVHLSLHLLKAC